MLTLKLPDGSVRQVPEGTRPRDVAESIGKRLAQAAVAAKVDGDVVDLDRELPDGNGELAFQILTDKDPRSARRAAAQLRPRHGPRRHAAVPRRAARLRPGHREWLLLRHRLADRRSARRTSRASRRR